MVTSERSELDYIRRALKPLKLSKKIELNFYDILELAESFKMMNRPVLAQR